MKRPSLHRGGSMSARTYALVALLSAAPLAIVLIVLSAALVDKVRETGAIDAIETAALRCARASERTDQDIADCYTNRGLEVPDDL